MTAREPKLTATGAAEVFVFHDGTDYAVFMVYLRPGARGGYYALAIESSFGNGYAYAFGAPGSCFYSFLARTGRHYIINKMTMGEEPVFDGEETADALRKEVNRALADGECNEDTAENEKELLAALSDEANWQAFQRDTVLFESGYELHEWVKTSPNARVREFTALYEHFWPAFAAEMEKRAAAVRASAEAPA